jgi:Flp pilus assembly protein TadG
MNADQRHRLTPLRTGGRLAASWPLNRSAFNRSAVAARRPAQALVELALVSAALLLLLFAIFQGIWWAYAQNVVTAAVQDGAQRASTRDGDLARAQQRAQDLLTAGLGPSAALVKLTLGQDSQSVRVTASGQWPVATVAGMRVTLPLHAEARMARERWVP